MSRLLRLIRVMCLIHSVFKNRFRIRNHKISIWNKWHLLVATTNPYFFTFFHSFVTYREWGTVVSVLRFWHIWWFLLFYSLVVFAIVYMYDLSSNNYTNMHLLNFSFYYPDPSLSLSLSPPPPPSTNLLL